VEPVQDAEEVFRWLRALGIPVVLTTGFDRDITDLLLTQLNWNEHVVDAAVCGDEVKEGRPAPFLIYKAMELTSIGNVQEVANIGDTILDLQAGHTAGCRWNIGVLSGAHNRRMLESVPHTNIIGSVADLPALWNYEK
jgi:phosphonatase-like hydrolase